MLPTVIYFVLLKCGELNIWFGNKGLKKNDKKMPEVEAPEKRKRGRPRKEPATPAASADALSTEKESAEPVVKRGRGRPKGSTKKKDADPKPAGPKRPRGRPKGSVKKKAANKAEAPKKSSE